MYRSLQIDYELVPSVDLWELSSLSAPIVLFAYNRPLHTERTIDALAANYGAGESDLFIFCDGPREASDLCNVERVRDFVKTVDGFKTVNLTFRDNNLGLADSIITGVSSVFEKYSSAIVFEDDLLSSSYTLSFLNKALERYRNEERVFSISAWAPSPSVLPVPRKYPWDVYFAHRFGCWGWATWRDRWEKVDWQVHTFPEFSQSRWLQRAFNRGGEDLTPMLFDWKKGENQSWAIRFSYAQFQHGGVGLYPVCSYTDNIGLDGTGVHCSVDCKLRNEVSLALSEVRLPDHILVDPEIERLFKRVYRTSSFVINVLKASVKVFKKLKLMLVFHFNVLSKAWR